jgi:hypothetical protein
MNLYYSFFLRLASLKHTSQIMIRSYLACDAHANKSHAAHLKEQSSQSRILQSSAVSGHWCCSTRDEGQKDLVQYTFSQVLFACGDAANFAAFSFKISFETLHVTFVRIKPLHVVTCKVDDHLPRHVLRQVVGLSFVRHCGRLRAKTRDAQPLDDVFVGLDGCARRTSRNRVH